MAMNSDKTFGSTGATGAVDGDWLDRVLADDARAYRDAYVADEGFVARVMQALPAPLTLPAWRKPVVLALWGVAATGIALAMPSAVLEVGREAYRLLAAQPVSLSGIAGAVVAMIVVTSAAAAYTLRASD
jgi:hypothetical protein